MLPITLHLHTAPFAVFLVECGYLAHTEQEGSTFTHSGSCAVQGILSHMRTYGTTYQGEQNATTCQGSRAHLGIWTGDFPPSKRRKREK